MRDNSVKPCITEKVLSAYFDCARKSHMLMFARDSSRRTEYEVMMDSRKAHLRANYLAGHSPCLLGPVAAPAGVRTESLATEQIAFIKRVRGTSKPGEDNYEPVGFSATHTIRSEDKMEVSFAGYVISRAGGMLPLQGRVVLLDRSVKTVRISEGIKRIRETINTLEDWVVTRPEPPRVLLNKHCPYCEFQHICKPIAEKEDSISQLGGITNKELNRFEKKGIFTLKQLSFLYRPRKRSRRTRSNGQSHKYELQALALRTGKIYIQDKPAIIPRFDTEIFFDIEADPNTDFYYLIGVLVSVAGHSKIFQFWANRRADEQSIWQDFVALLGRYPGCPLFHYGSFERKAMVKLGKRYGTPTKFILDRLFNVNSSVFGKTYFPVKYNGLKDICRFLGLSWSSKDASGLQSIVWRYKYEDTADERYRKILLTYNREDCEHLKALTETLREIESSAAHAPDVRFADVEGGSLSESASDIVRQFSHLLQSAHGSYEQAKIKLKKKGTPDGAATKGRSSRAGRKSSHPKVTKFINVRRGRTCPHHPGTALKPRETQSVRTIVDLVFTSRGVKKVVNQYVGKMGYCVACKTLYSPPFIRRLGRGWKYGHGLQAWSVYHRMALRLPYDKISQLIEDIFSEQVGQARIMSFVTQMSRYYIPTEKLLLKHILEAPVVHADETTINIRGATQYVWVLTDGKHVVFRLTPSREAAVVHEWLDGYSGVLCSDFYAGYDSVDCVQQKCWAHLIRDLNDDLRKSPFDAELEDFVSSVRDLIVPIFETAEKFGLKTRNLRKFKRSVEQFYEFRIVGKTYRSDLMVAYQKRFSKYKDKLFVFLERDGVPWNNNMAERALRHLAVQRKISGSFNDGAFLHYLRLLGVTQSCRFQNKSLLQFMLSGGKDVDRFESKGHLVGWRMR